MHNQAEGVSADMDIFLLFPPSDTASGDNASAEEISNTALQNHQYGDGDNNDSRAGAAAAIIDLQAQPTPSIYCDCEGEGGAGCGCRAGRRVGACVCPHRITGIEQQPFVSYTMCLSNTIL